MKETVKHLLKGHPALYGAVAEAYSLIRMIPRALDARSGVANWLKCYFSAKFKTAASYGKPIALTIEPTNICDQKCTICETGLGILDRKPGHMSFEQFKAILDQFDDSLQSLLLYFMGESFLNKDAYRMIRYAADRGIYVSACTNCNFIDPEELVKSGIADIQFQIAGTTPEVHAEYRVGGDLDKALENLRETLRLRDEYAGTIARPYPMNIGMGFILLRPNEHQVDDFLQLADSLGVDEAQIIDPCVRTVEQGRELLPTDRNHWIYDPEAFAQGRLAMRRRPDNRCDWLYASMTIQVNGDVVPCCRDPKGLSVLGNVLADNVYSIWNGEKYRALRRQVARNQDGMKLCSLCEGYDLPEVRE